MFSRVVILKHDPKMPTRNGLRLGIFCTCKHSFNPGNDLSSNWSITIGLTRSYIENTSVFRYKLLCYIFFCILEAKREENTTFQNKNTGGNSLLNLAAYSSSSSDEEGWKGTQEYDVEIYHVKVFSDRWIEFTRLWQYMMFGAWRLPHKNRWIQ